MDLGNERDTRAALDAAESELAEVQRLGVKAREAKDAGGPNAASARARSDALGTRRPGPSPNTVE